ncbi:MAG TPA: STAS domain-containing protein [Nocardioides sp.]|uniref:STAS domain-containing protein n=1 Tax=Nocardioides sp. TaxID=35761 RepID=UPI002D7EE37B|nr:STAS domain-containing protein [Nocardioides sp.]HET6652713.1 STAS domain-containing protein [Nocardioides sp.]
MLADTHGPITEVATNGQQTVVTLTGEIDLSNHAALRGGLNDLITGGTVHLVLDMSGVTFIDSTGLGALIGTRRRVHAFHGSLAIVLNDPATRRVFEVTALDKVFDLHHTLDSALRTAS